MGWIGMGEGGMEGREVAMMQIVQEERVEEHEQKDEIRREGIKKKEKRRDKDIYVSKHSNARYEI